MLITVDTDATVEEIYDSMSQAEKKEMLGLLVNEPITLSLAEQNNNQKMVESVISYVQKNFGCGSLYIGELIDGINKIKQGEVLL